MPTRIGLMPTKLKYKLAVSFSLMSILPIMAGLYIASLFIQFPFTVNPESLLVVSLVAIFSLILALLGYGIMRQVMQTVLAMTENAQDIAQGKLDPAREAKGTDELEDLSRSLKMISQNAKELLEKVEKLTPRDKLTGLYTVNYIHERLEEEIQRAIHYQRPCSFAYFSIVQFTDYAARVGTAASEEILKGIGQLMNDGLTQFDRAARIGRDEFVIIFPDKNKRKTIEIVSRIGEMISDLLAKRSSETPLSVSIGVSENPIDGISANELFIKAQARMRTARSKGPNLVEAFA